MKIILALLLPLIAAAAHAQDRFTICGDPYPANSGVATAYATVNGARVLIDVSCGANVLPDGRQVPFCQVPRILKPGVHQIGLAACRSVTPTDTSQCSPVTQKAYRVDAACGAINSATSRITCSVAMTPEPPQPRAAVECGVPVAAQAWRAVGPGTLYTVANGKLASAITGRKATAGALCNCAAPIAVGTSRYCPLAGATIGEATLCKESP